MLLYSHRYSGCHGRAPRRRHRPPAQTPASPNETLPGEEEHQKDAGPEEGADSAAKELEGLHLAEDLEVE